jgi:putative sterol carrier protein
MKWLSQEWADALTAALNADEDFRKAAKGRDVVLRYQHVEGPDGDLTYAMTLADGEATVALGEPADADITFTMKHADAARITRGEINSQQAAMGGQIKTDVNPMKVMRIVPVLQARERVEGALDVEVPA